MLVPKRLQQRFSGRTFRAPQFEAWGCSAWFSARGVMWRAGWGQGHPSTRCCMNTSTIVHPNGWMLVASDTAMPVFILCCENGSASSLWMYSHQHKCWTLIATFHQMLPWRELEGGKNLVLPSYARDIRHFWQESKGKHQNTLFLPRTSLPFCYLINLTCCPSCPSSRLFHCWEIWEVTTSGWWEFKRITAAEKGNEEFGLFWVIWKLSCTKQVHRKEWVHT